MKNSRSTQIAAADPTDPNDRLTAAIRAAVAMYEREIRGRRSAGTRPAGLASTDPSDPAGRFTGRIVSALAEHERELRRQRVARAARAKARYRHGLRQPPSAHGAARARR